MTVTCTTLLWKQAEHIQQNTGFKIELNSPTILKGEKALGGFEISSWEQENFCALQAILWKTQPSFLKRTSSKKSI